MGKKIYTVAIIGVGHRGADAYGARMHQMTDKYKIVALCDKDEEKLSRYGAKFGVAEESRFVDEDEFFKEKRADVLVIATQDKDHVGHAIKAFKKGYDILVEKPLTRYKEECEELLKAQKESGRTAHVCHVLRYAPAFVKVARLIDEGTIGRLVAIDALEQVGYWHQAHSFVRGHWRNTTSTESAPMIIAKSCHDLDLLQWYAKSKCKSISSVGGLTYFKSENAPEGAAKRCTECRYVDECAYSAKKIYIDRWKALGSHEDGWPFNVPAIPPLTEEKLLKGIKEGPYGRCVFDCDNNVVDHQLVDMTFENGVKAHLTMTGFTHSGGRKMTFFGTLGEIVLNAEENTITIGRFGTAEKEVIDVTSLLTSDLGYEGHGGGDTRLICTLYDVLEGKTDAVTSLEASIESHLMGICAEESRLQGGKLINVHE